MSTFSIKGNPGLATKILYLFILTSIGLGQSNIIAVIFKIILIFAVADRFLRDKEQTQYVSNAFYKWGVAFIAIFWLSLFWAVNGNLGVSLNITLSLNIGYCFIAFYLINGSKEIINNCLSIYIIGSIIFGLYCYLTFGTISRSAELSTSLLTMGHLAAISIVVCVYRYIHFLQKKLYFTLIILFSIIIVLSGTKKALILPIISCSAYLFFKVKGRKKLKSVLFIVIIISIVFYAIMDIPILYNMIGNRIESMILGFQGAGKSQVDASTLGRMGFMKYGLEHIKERPWLGYGPDSFIFKYASSHPDSWVAYSHNNFIEIAFSVGIIGLIIYYSIYFIVLKKLYKIYTRYNDTVSLLLFSLLIGIIVIHYGWVAYFQLANNFILVFAASYALARIQKTNDDYRNIK